MATTTGEVEGNTPPDSILHQQKNSPSLDADKTETGATATTSSEPPLPPPNKDKDEVMAGPATEITTESSNGNFHHNPQKEHPTLSKPEQSASVPGTAQSNDATNNSSPKDVVGETAANPRNPVQPTTMVAPKPPLVSTIPITAVTAPTPLPPTNAAVESIAPQQPTAGAQQQTITSKLPVAASVVAAPPPPANGNHQPIAPKPYNAIVSGGAKRVVVPQDSINALLSLGRDLSSSDGTETPNGEDGTVIEEEAAAAATSQHPNNNSNMVPILPDTANNDHRKKRQKLFAMDDTTIGTGAATGGATEVPPAPSVPFPMKKLPGINPAHYNCIAVKPNTDFWCWLGPDEGLGDWDVLCGRGGESNNYIGNKRYRKVVNERKDDYRKIPVKQRKAKTAFVRDIVRYITDRGGRFIEQDPVSGRYFVVTNEKARKKTSQALRETKELKWLDTDTEEKNKLNKTTSGTGTIGLNTSIGKDNIVCTYCGLPGHKTKIAKACRFHHEWLDANPMKQTSKLNSNGFAIANETTIDGNKVVATGGNDANMNTVEAGAASTMNMTQNDEKERTETVRSENGGLGSSTSASNGTATMKATTGNGIAPDPRESTNGFRGNVKDDSVAAATDAEIVSTLTPI